MTTSKRITSNSLILMTAELSARLMRLVLVICAARMLGALDYGKFSFALAFNSLFLILMDWGVHQLAVREIARKPDMVQKYIGNALILKITSIILTVLLIFTIISVSGKSYDVVLVVFLLSLSFSLNSFSELFKSVFQAFEEMKYDAYSTWIGNLLTTILGVLILIFSKNIIHLSFAYLIASLLNFFYCYFVITEKFTKIRMKIDLELMKFMFREGFPFGILFFFAMLYTYIDTVMLSFMKGDEVVGWYNAAYRLVFAVLFIPRATMKAVFPALSRYYKTSMKSFNDLFQMSFKIMLILGLPLSFAITLFADKIILLIYDQQYLNSIKALQILIWSSGLVFVTTVLTHTTRSADRQKFTAKIVAIGAFVNVVLNLILIHFFSYIGAAVATIVTQLFTLIAHLVYVSKSLQKIPISKLFFKMVIVNVIIGLVVLFIKDFNWILAVFAGIAVYVPMLIVTKYFSKNEFKQFMDIFVTFKIRANKLQSKA